MANRIGSARLRGHLTLDLGRPGEGATRTARIATSLSGLDRAGDWLFVGSDESPGLDRLERVQRRRFGRRATFPVRSILDLPGDAGEEVDIESIAIDRDWLWLTTSHALLRPTIETGLSAFAAVQRPLARFLIARLPLARDRAGRPSPVARDGARVARCLPQTASGSALIEAMRADPFLALFLEIPAKENGLDIEGLAVRGDHLVLGLRGPVLRGQAVLLDLQWDDGAGAGAIPLVHWNGLPYRRVFVDLDGLGIRDLCRHRRDLYILAGPTMPVPVPFRLYRVRDYFHTTPPPTRLAPEPLCHVPSTIGHPEGLTIFKVDRDATITFAMTLDGSRADDRGRTRAALVTLA